MSYTTEFQTELAAVNEVLTSLGQTPVTNVNQSNPDVAVITQTLNVTSREVQGEGWNFNTEYDYELSFDAGTGEIGIPANVLRLDLTDDTQYRGIRSVIRQSKLYNATDHTYVWTENVNVDIVWWIELSDCPRPIYDYIVARTCSMASNKLIGDPQIFQILQSREAYTRAFALDFDCTQGDYSYFGQPKGGSFYNSFKPYHALAR